MIKMRLTTVVKASDDDNKRVAGATTLCPSSPVNAISDPKWHSLIG